MKQFLPLILFIVAFLFCTFNINANNNLTDYPSPTDHPDKIKCMTCPVGDILLTSQSEVTNFTVNYPGCTALLGSLIIGPSENIVNLDGLNGITSINNSLVILDNILLENIVGLMNVTTIGAGGGAIDITNNNLLSQIDLSNASAPVLFSVRIDRDSALTDLMLPPDITTGGFISIFGNPLLANITEFDNLTQLTNYLQIHGTAVSALPLFQNLINVFGIAIEDNPLITSLPPFTSLSNITGGNLSIRDNPLITNIDFSTVSAPNLVRVDISLNDNLTNLDLPLDIETVTTGFRIFENPQLANISEQNNLQTIGAALCIQSTLDPVLPSFSNLISVGTGLRISNNNLITALPSFASLTNIFGGGISFTQNPLLNNIDISTVSAPAITNIQIWNNDLLTQVNLPGDITTISQDLGFLNNPLLTHISEFDNLTFIGGRLGFQNISDPVLPLFPNLTSIGDGIFFRSLSTITEIPPFASLTEILGGPIHVAGCPLITEIDLSAISAPNLYDVSINFNNALTDLLLSEDITSLTVDLLVAHNPNLTNINDFNSLQTIGRNLEISHTLLCELPDFPNLVTIQTDPANAFYGGLIISNNNKIISIDKFPSLTFIDSVVTITNNSLLSNCAIGAVCDYLPSPRDRTISNNAGDCTDEASLINHCTNGPTILPPVFPGDLTVPIGTTVTLSISNLPANYEAVWYDSDMITILYQDLANNFDFTVNDEITLYGAFVPLGTNCTSSLEPTTFLTALPVELLSFKASLGSNNQTNLSWQTTSELNNHYFQIEHSTDARSFYPLGRVDGKGTTNELQSYAYNHDSPTYGHNYYRLQQVDFDGNYTYSDITNINLINKEESHPLIVAPNPTSNILSLSNPSLIDLQLEVFSSTERLAFRSNITAGQNKQLPIEYLENGIYLIRINKGGEFFYEKFIKISR